MPQTVSNLDMACMELFEADGIEQQAEQIMECILADGVIEPCELPDYNRARRMKASAQAMRHEAAMRLERQSMADHWARRVQKTANITEGMVSEFRAFRRTFGAGQGQSETPAALQATGARRDGNIAA